MQLFFVSEENIQVMPENENIRYMWVEVLGARS